MKIGGFEVGEFAVKESGGKRHCVFDCRNCVYSASISDDKACRYHVVHALGEVDADDVVLSEVYQRVYSEDQTKLLAEISALAERFEAEGVWSLKHLGLEGKESEPFLPQRHDALVRICHDLLRFDPIAAYIACLNELKRETSRFNESDDVYRKATQPYIETLQMVRRLFESTDLVQRSKGLIARLKEAPDTTELYRGFFEAEIKPSFIGSRITFGETEKLDLLDEYAVQKSTVQIFSHPDKVENLYFVNPPEYSLPPDKYFILSKTREIVSGYQPGRTSLSDVSKSRRYFERIYVSTIKDVARTANISLSGEEVSELAEIVARYTVGYGTLEILLSDRKLTDVYLDAPIGSKAMYVVHSDFGQCQTNVLYNDTEAKSMVSKLRAMSGRPFDEAHPVLDFDLPSLETRVAVIGPPLSPDGTAFAFRLHKVTPWTLPQFIDLNFISPLAAGLVSFLIDSQATTIITGSRGSGKTSLLGACMQEIPQNSRILVQEDTLELPVDYLKRIGFNIQRLKTRSPISVSATESEVDPAESLRTALRLGDSALVLGEVRSKEAKVLYEAMRVGAAGNIVMGTIHGDSAYAVWDRVVNDLEVPTTSFKATDLVVVARPIRFGGSLKRHRRVVQVTEVKKHWTEDPESEGGLLDLMLYDAKKDSLELLEDNFKESELFEKISRVSGLSMKQMWAEIRLRAESKSFLVELRRKQNVPQLLESEHSILAANKLALLKEQQLEEHGSVETDEVLGKWKYWAKNVLLPNVSKKKS
ncbi:MAG: type II/IV secretion system ATPase subunit [Candidatus Diapherotrites archaeon]|nr:type II/IV secretion system ATPase subunit [Candidatus Diapherotrites archaeon]